MTRPTLVPTPRDLHGTSDVAEVPVVDLPMRHDEPTATALDGRETFSAVVLGPGGHKLRTIAGVTNWRIHDGALSIYGPLPDGRVVKLRTVSAFEWVDVYRQVTGGEAR